MSAQWWASRKRVTVVVDTPGWYDTHAQALCAALAGRGYDVHQVRHHADVPEGDVAFYLSCMKLTPKAILQRNRLNLVVHASALPHGRGFSPMVWQILEGKSRIPLAMIEAVEDADAGAIYETGEIAFEGHELNGELRAKMGAAINAMCLALIDRPELPQPRAQSGEASWYRRRRAEDSRLDPHKTLAEQFDLLRIVDNARYPAFFEHRGQRYVLKVEKMDSGKTGSEGVDA